MCDDFKEVVSIKVISEGSTPMQRVRGEWGISMQVGNDILFDTFGHPDIFKKNLIENGVRPRNIKSVIISHAHWDHISGLKEFLTINRNCTVYVPENIKKVADICGEAGVKLVVTARPAQIGENIFVTGGLKASIKDEILKEQALIVKGEKGYVLIAGCSHPGIVKMVEKAKKLVKEDIYAAVGGFHLKDTTIKRIDKIAAALKKLGVKEIAGGHCTGKNGVNRLKKVFGRGFKALKAGKTYFY